MSVAARFLVFGRRFVAVSIVALAPGCYAETVPDAEYVDTAPPAYYSAPQYVYEGRPVYYVNDRWYTRDGDRWMYYRHEPPQLARQPGYVQQAPPAPPRFEQREYSAPVRRAPRANEYAVPMRQAAPVREHEAPARRSAPPARGAPDAVRVR